MLFLNAAAAWIGHRDALRCPAMPWACRREPACLPPGRSKGAIVEMLSCGFFCVGFSSFWLKQYIHFSLPTVLNTLAHTLASFLWLLALARFDLSSTFIFHYPLSSIPLLTLLLLFYGCWLLAGISNQKNSNFYKKYSILHFSFFIFHHLALLPWLLASGYLSR
jgi:hypothetical protein